MHIIRFFLQTRTRKLLLAAGLITVLLLSQACSEDPEVGPPAISLVEPASGKAGTVITISGTNFSSSLANVLVTFNDVEAEVTSSTKTEIQVKVPARAGDGVLKVTIGSKATNGPTFDYIENIVVSTFAGSVEGYTDGTGIGAQFRHPAGMILDGSGNILLANDYGIRKITMQGVVTTIAGVGYGYVDGAASEAKFARPIDLVRDNSGNIYVADSYNNRIRKIAPDGTVSTFAGSTAGYTDGALADAKFDRPEGIAIDASGNIYVSDSRNHRIRKISGGNVTTLAGSTSGDVDASGMEAKFNYPIGIRVSPTGDLVVCDYYNAKLRKVTSAGVVTTVASNLPGITFSATDAVGNVYGASWSYKQLYKITPAGFVTVFTGTGVSGNVNGSLETAQFGFLYGLVINSVGEIFLSDSGNSLIRKIGDE